MKRGSKTWDLLSVKQRFPDAKAERSEKIFKSRGVHKDELCQLQENQNEQQQILLMEQIATLSTRNPSQRKKIIQGYKDTQ